MIEEKETILLTGINGYIAGRTAEALLEAGYRIHGTVRNLESAKPTCCALIEFEKQGDIEIFQVPDITKRGAFDEAVRGVSGIVHIASPIGVSFDRTSTAMETAKVSVQRVLESAALEPTMQTVILMSSISAIRHEQEGPYVFTEKDWNHESESIVEALGDAAPGHTVYRASKTAAERAFWNFRKEEKPTFTMTSINPSFVHGPPLVVPESIWKIGGTPGFIVSIQAGIDGPELFKTNPWWVDVRDVAHAVTCCFKSPEMADGERYLACSAYGPQQAVADVLRGANPKSRAKRGNPGEGYLTGYKSPGKQTVDGTKLIALMEREYIPYEKSVLDTANAYEPLLGRLGPALYFTKAARSIQRILWGV